MSEALNDPRLLPARLAALAEQAMQMVRTLHGLTGGVGTMGAAREAEHRMMLSFALAATLAEQIALASDAAATELEAAGNA